MESFDNRFTSQVDFKKILNSDDQQFHEYQQSHQSTLTSTRQT